MNPAGSIPATASETEASLYKRLHAVLADVPHDLSLHLAHKAAAAIRHCLRSCRPEQNFVWSYICLDAFIQLPGSLHLPASTRLVCAHCLI